MSPIRAFSAVSAVTLRGMDIAASTQPVTARLPIWSPGVFTSLSGDRFEFRDADLAAIAEGYSPQAFAAPIVKGHPATDDPAQGWVEGLEWDGKYLWAQADKIDPAFADEARAGRYRKISPRFFLPNEPGNPTPGRYYLRHVGFLGAAAPANKELPLADFAEGDGTVTFADGPELPVAAFSGGAPRWGFRALADWARKLREFFISRDGLDAADQAVPEYLISDLASAANPPADKAAVSPGFADPEPSTQEDVMSDPTPEQQAAFAEAQAQLERERAELEQQRQQIIEQQQQAERAARRTECAAFAEQLVADGRLLPAEAPFVIELLTDIPPDAQCAFAEGDVEVTVNTGERLRELLAALPVRVDYQERGAGDPQPDASFAAPAGYSVDPAAAELHAKAKAYAAEHNVDFVAALAAVQQ